MAAARSTTRTTEVNKNFILDVSERFVIQPWSRYYNRVPYLQSSI